MSKLHDRVKEYIDANPTLSKTEIARLLCKNYPTLFRSVESARHHVRSCSDGVATTSINALTSDEQELIEKYRESKSQLEHECQSAGIDVKSVKHYWYKSERFSIFAKNSGKSIHDLKRELMEGMKEYSPTFQEIKYRKIKDGHCLVIDPADIHIGKLASAYETGNEYNVNIAIKRVKDGIDGILNKCQHFPIDQILLITGNDILHTDTTKRTTTSGTPQDTDGQWYDNFLRAKDLFVQVIDQLIPIAKVHVMHNVSNHDYMNGWFLSQVIETWYRKCKSVTFDSDMKHRKAFMYGDNLIASTHGDGAKEQDLPLLLAHEFPMHWSKAKHKYIYTHHIHHKRAKDYIGVTVESSRSASGADGWHHRNGYVGAPKAIEAYLHHKNNGQVARISHIFT